MNRRWTLPTASLLAIAVGWAVVSHHERPQAGAAAGAPPRQPVQAERPVWQADGGARNVEPAAAGRTPRGGDGEVSAAGAEHAPRQGDVAAARHDLPSRAELERRAQLVERDASRELARLVPLLDLDPAQQARVFQALARSSPNFVPGMLVDGRVMQASPNNSPQSVLDELSDAQIAAYLQDSDERSAWWHDYIGSVASQLDSGTPAVGGGTGVVAAVPAGDPTPPVDSTPATKAAHAITGDE